MVKIYGFRKLVYDRNIHPKYEAPYSKSPLLRFYHPTYLNPHINMTKKANTTQGNCWLKVEGGCRAKGELPKYGTYLKRNGLLDEVRHLVSVKG